MKCALVRKVVQLKGWADERDYINFAERNRTSEILELELIIFTSKRV